MVDKPNPTPPTDDTSTIARLTRLVIAFTPLIMAVGGLVTAIYANIGVSENDSQTELAYTQLAERVNKIDHDLAYITGRMEAKEAALSAPSAEARHAIEGRMAALASIKQLEEEAARRAIESADATDAISDKGAVEVVQTPLPLHLDDLVKRLRK